jgi:DNA-binding NtrC family response regulator
MAKQGKLLIADDNKNILQALTLFLQFEFEYVQTIHTTTNIIQELEKVNYDIVLLDMNFKAGQNTGNEGLFWLREIKQRFPDVEVVMITAYGDVNLAVNALKEGAADFVLKPWDNDKLVATLKAALRIRKSGQEIKELRNKEKSIKSELNRNDNFIVGTSEAMQNIMQMIQKVAATDANILITGENGTGKEMIAKEIHRLSHRNEELFVLVDLSSLSESLFESELFGHKKGAFTDAYEDRAGKFVVANKGSLFLDEIGNIPLHLQSKLLTVLQTRVVRPVGSNREIPVDIRLICATNKNIQLMAANNEFRQDLLYRINTIQIHIPPLRERVADIEDLSRHFLKIFGKKYNKLDLKFDKGVIEKFQRNPWYGNIRELQHTIEKAVILSDRNILYADDFMFGTDSFTSSAMPETLDEMESKMITDALKKYNQNYSLAASKLGITRPTLYSKIKKYGI